MAWVFGWSRHSQELMVGSLEGASHLNEFRIICYILCKVIKFLTYWKDSNSYAISLVTLCPHFIMRQSSFVEDKMYSVMKKVLSKDFNSMKLFNQCWLICISKTCWNHLNCNWYGNFPGISVIFVLYFALNSDSDAFSFNLNFKAQTPKWSPYT